jgi:predicted signal transduction protein with EAL and GGDEF domain
MNCDPVLVAEEPPCPCCCIMAVFPLMPWTMTIDDRDSPWHAQIEALAQVLERSGAPGAVLLVKDDARVPDGWETAWVCTGWALETEEAPADHGDGHLVVLTWKGFGELMPGLPKAVQPKQLTATGGNPPAATSMPAVGQGGVMRRGDFIARLSAMSTAADGGCSALLAIRVDQLTTLSGLLDAVAMFELEDRIASRIEAALDAQDLHTIWMELGFGVVVQRENSTLVEALAMRICEQVSAQVFMVDGKPMPLTVSVGVALPREQSGEGWFASAHAAQAIASRRGGNRWVGVLTRAYDPMPAERVLIVQEWVEDAKTGSNVMIEFQPVVPTQAGAAGLYALHAKLRDFRAPLGGVYRDEFQRIASEAGAMAMIDRISLFRAFELLEQEQSGGRRLSLIVPIDFATLDGVPWRWLQAEVQRRREFVPGLILELEASAALLEPQCIERVGLLHDAGVRIAISERSPTLDRAAPWLQLPVDFVRLQMAVVDAAIQYELARYLETWQKQGGQLILDGVTDAGALALSRFEQLGARYLCGDAMAAIGPRLDFGFVWNNGRSASIG